MKKKQILLLVLIMPLTMFMTWHSLTELRHRSLISEISECQQQSMKYNGIERVRKFVSGINQIHPWPVSREVRMEFENYKALWNESLKTYDQTGNYGNYDKDIGVLAQKLREF